MPGLPGRCWRCWLAREGIPVVLIEAQGNFDRDFRGDSLHPALLDVVDQIGLADDLLQLPHTKIRKVTLPTGSRLGPPG